MTLMLDTVLCTTVYCHTVHCVWRIDELRSEFFDYRIRIFHHSCFRVPWNRASQLTGGSGGRPNQHRKGALCMRQCCSSNAVRGLGDWALWIPRRGYNANRWLLVASSWDCNWRGSNCPWGSFEVLLHVSRQNTVARIRINESVRPNQTSSWSSERSTWHLTHWIHRSCGWYIPASHSFCTAAWKVSKFQHLFRRLPFASSQVPVSGNSLSPPSFCQLAWGRNHVGRCENDARVSSCSSMLHHHEIYIEHTQWFLSIPVCTQLCDWI